MLRLEPDLEPEEEPALLRVEAALPRVDALPRLEARPPLELALLRDEVLFRPLELAVPRAASARLRTALPASLAALPAS